MNDVIQQLRDHVLAEAPAVLLLRAAEERVDHLLPHLHEPLDVHRIQRTGASTHIVGLEGRR
jgi:hypothetical protein